MITRRELLAFCSYVPFAVTTIPCTGSVVPVRVSSVWYDERAASFALASFSNTGLRKLPTDLSVIYNEMVSCPTRGFAGITDPRLLFAIEGLAAHVGFRLVALEQHAASHTAGRQAAVVDSLTRVEPGCGPIQTLHLQREAFLAPGRTTLFSWLFLPRPCV